MSSKEGRGDFDVLTYDSKKKDTGEDEQVPNFIIKTWNIFNDHEYPGICEWNKRGDCIRIIKPMEFGDVVLSKYFKHRNTASFIRQLNMYGFRKTEVDPSKREFKHPHFVKDKKDLLRLIKKVSTGKATNKVYDEHRVYSDKILSELKDLRERSEALNERVRKTEEKNQTLHEQNNLLWSQLRTSKQNQANMKKRLQRIYVFLYQVFLQQKKRLKISGDIHMPSFADDSLNVDDFRNAMKVLCMQDPDDCSVEEINKFVGSLTPASKFQQIEDSKKRKFQDIATECKTNEHVISKFEEILDSDLDEDSLSVIDIDGQLLLEKNSNGELFLNNTGNKIDKDSSNIMNLNTNGQLLLDKIDGIGKKKDEHSSNIMNLNTNGQLLLDNIDGIGNKIDEDSLSIMNLNTNGQLLLDNIDGYGATIDEDSLSVINLNTDGQLLLDKIDGLECSLLEDYDANDIDSLLQYIQTDTGEYTDDINKLIENEK